MSATIATMRRSPSPRRLLSWLPVLALPLAACDESKLPPMPAAPRPNGSASAVVVSAEAPAAPPPTTAAGRAADALFALRSYRHLTLSSDGARLAYSVALDPLRAPKQRTVFVLDRRSPDAAPQRVGGATGTSEGAISERSPAFSPDGKSLAVVSEGKAGRPAKLWIIDVEGNAPAKSYPLGSGAGSSLRFSSDGGRLAYLTTDHAPDRAPGDPDIHDLASPPPGQRLEILNLTTGERLRASPADLQIHDYAFTPDGNAFVAIASPAARPDYFSAKLVSFSATGGGARVIHSPARQLGEPRVSPDGKLVAFIEGLMSDEGNTGGDLFVVPIEGGPAKNLTAGRKGTIVAARFRPESRSLVADEIVDGRYALDSIPIEGGQGETLFQAEAAFWGLELAADGDTVAFTHASLDAPLSIWSGPVRAPQPIAATRQTFDKPWGMAWSLHAPSDAYSIQSFLTAPPKVEPGRRYPLIVIVHGGPAASAVAMLHEYESLAAEGYFILRPNPRGSFGQGEAFQEANAGDLGGGDLRDIQASVKAAVEAAPIDPEQVAIAGWSYGGFMTMWAVTQTTQFRAAVAGAGIVDWTSYYGQTDIAGWMPPYFGASVYDQPAAYAKSSPILFIQQAKTPTLVIVGENDTDCPAPQSRQFWQALAERGVPSQLVIYPGEAHGFSSPLHRRDRIERMAAWFQKYMPSK